MLLSSEANLKIQGFGNACIFPAFEKFLYWLFMSDFEECKLFGAYFLFSSHQNDKAKDKRVDLQSQHLGVVIHESMELIK